MLIQEEKVFINNCIINYDYDTYPEHFHSWGYTHYLFVAYPEVNEQVVDEEGNLVNVGFVFKYQYN